MRAIYKYEFDMSRYVQRITMPIGAEVLTVDVQGDKIVLWAMVDPNTNNVETRVFVIMVTGQNVSNAETKRLRYIDTVQDRASWTENNIVWHVFEVLQSPEKGV